MNELEECFRKGLLRKIPASEENSIKSINKAKAMLIKAKEGIEYELFDSSLVLAYSAMFHATRSLLLRDGIRERSHYCISRYLEGTYVKAKKLDLRIVLLLDRTRELRHEELYSLEFYPTKEETSEAVRNAETIIKSIAGILKSE